MLTVHFLHIDPLIGVAPHATLLVGNNKSRPCGKCLHMYNNEPFTRWEQPTGLSQVKLGNSFALFWTCEITLLERQ